MKLPELKSKRKIRDAKICMMYLEGASEEEIGMRFEVHQSTINRILYKHRTALNADINHEKAKRVHWLKRQIKKRGDSNKDSADLMAQLHDEIEGNLKNVGQVAGETKLIIIRDNGAPRTMAEPRMEQTLGREISFNS